MNKDQWRKTFGWRAFEEYSVPMFLLLPLGGVLYHVVESSLPTVRDIVFVLVWEAIFLTWAWTRKLWPFGPW